MKFILASTLILTYSCSVPTPSEDIEIVKNSEKSVLLGNNYSFSDFVSDIAGNDGTEQWTYFVPQGYKNNRKIAGVQADINKHAVKYNLIQIQFLYNRKRKLAKISKIKIDGQSKSKLEFYKILAEIGINSIKSDLDL
jgi:hypothetical protein